MKMLHVSVFLTAHKRSYGKVMYLHLSVILFTGGVCIPACIGQGYVFPSMQWDRVVSAQGGVCLGGVYHPIETVTEMGCTHPTGMHSC